MFLFAPPLSKRAPHPTPRLSQSSNRFSFVIYLHKTQQAFAAGYHFLLLCPHHTETPDEATTEPVSDANTLGFIECKLV